MKVNRQVSSFVVFFVIDCHFDFFYVPNCPGSDQFVENTR